VAIVGVSSIPRKVTNFNASAVELRSLDGASKVQIDGGGSISIKAAGDVKVTSTGTVQLNAPTGATALLNGVLLGSLPCPFGGTHGALAIGGIGITQKVVAG
jgi:hypothetical protein